MGYKADMLELEGEIADLVPATLVAVSFIEAMFENNKDGEDKGGFQPFLISADTVAAASFAVSDLRQRALRLSRIFHGHEEGGG